MTPCCGKEDAIDPIVAEGNDDHDLMSAAAQGQEEAFALLVGRHLRSVTAVAQRMLGNAAEADEVSQETFLRLWRQAPKWDPNGTATIKTWLQCVATNLCLDLIRRRRQVSLDEIDDVEDLTQRPHEVLQNNKQRVIIQQCLLFLPERQRAAIILSYFEELKDQEVADIMEISVGAVESLLVRGRKALRNQMEQLNLQWGEDF